MSNVDNEKVAQTIASLNNKFENKVANKKDNISGDFSDDGVSYPTVRGAKNHFGQKVTEFSTVPVDTNYPSEKLVKDTIDGLETDLTDDLTIDVVKQASADTGYASTYYVTQGGVQVGAKIQIMKDKMLRSASVETVGPNPTVEEQSYHMAAGDQYILLVVNTADSDSPSRLIIPISTVFDLQKADEITVSLSNGVYSVKTGYVESVINDYLDAFIAGL